jgi:hypothetical protein
LAKRLLWAIDESKKLTSAQSQQKLLVYVNGTNIPEANEHLPIPTASLTVEDERGFKLLIISIQVRNGGRQISEPIPYTYLFADESFSKIASFRRSYFEAIMKAAPDDCQDGLMIQYQLSKTLPSLPIGATEQFLLEFYLEKVTLPSKTALLRFRLHDYMGPFDYPFLLELPVKEP